MRDTNAVFLEVMRKDNPKLLNRLQDLATARNNHYDHMRERLAIMRDYGPAETREGLRAGVNFAQREMDRKFDQAARMRSRLRKHGEANPSFWNDQNLRRAKWGVGLATVGAGVYGAYRYYKHRKNQQQKAKESTSKCYASLMEVMRKDDPVKLQHYTDVAREKMFRHSPSGRSLGISLNKKASQAGNQYSRMLGKQETLRKKLEVGSTIEDLKKRVSDVDASIKQGEELLSQMQQRNAEFTARFNRNMAPKSNLGRRLAVGAGVAALGIGAAKLGMGAYRARLRRQHAANKQKQQESTSECYASLMEVMRKDNPELLRHLVDKASMKMIRNLVQSPDKTIRGRDINQYIRLSQKLRKAAPTLKVDGGGTPIVVTPHNPAAVTPRVGWSTRKKIGVGLGAAAVGAGAYGLYRHYKNKQKAKESISDHFNSMLREGGIDAKHVELGLNILKATGFDQAMAAKMSDEKQRSQAWKYGLRGAAVGAALPAVDVAQENMIGLAHKVWGAHKSGVKGIGNILRTARDSHFSDKLDLGSQLGRAYTANPPLLGKVVAGTTGAGLLYGLMKKAPSDKKPAITMMKPKKQYKYIRKDNDRYVYPKKVGVKR